MQFAGTSVPVGQRHWRIDGVFAAPSGEHPVDPQEIQLAVKLRHQRCTLRKIVRLLQVPITTLARATRRLGLNLLRKLDPKPTVQRYQ